MTDVTRRPPSICSRSVRTTDSQAARHCQPADPPTESPRTARPLTGQIERVAMRRTVDTTEYTAAGYPAESGLYEPPRKVRTDSPRRLVCVLRPISKGGLAWR